MIDDKKKRQKEASKKWISNPENKKKHASRVRRKRLEVTYGITEKDYFDLIHLQDDKCAICKNPISSDFTKTTHVDHNHETNKVRGILCHNCNRGLGFFKDDISLLNNAINYLIKNL